MAEHDAMVPSVADSAESAAGPPVCDPIAAASGPEVVPLQTARSQAPPLQTAAASATATPARSAGHSLVEADDADADADQEEADDHTPVNDDPAPSTPPQTDAPTQAPAVPSHELAVQFIPLARVNPDGTLTPATHIDVIISAISTTGTVIPGGFYHRTITGGPESARAAAEAMLTEMPARLVAATRRSLVPLPATPPAPTVHATAATASRAAATPAPTSPVPGAPLGRSAAGTDLMERARAKLQARTDEGTTSAGAATGTTEESAADPAAAPKTACGTVAPGAPEVDPAQEVAQLSLFG